MENSDDSMTPLVFMKDGGVFANSRDIAAAFEKEHRNVLRDIDNLIEAEPACALNFELTSIKAQMPRGGHRTDRAYDMTRDGFTLLAMGFTGAKALKWKLRYIEAFNAMEVALSERAAAVAVLESPAQMRRLLTHYVDMTIELQGQVEEMRPAVQALERISISDGSMSITEAAKTLQVGPKALFGWLRANGWIYRRAGSASDLAYQSRLVAGYLEHKTTVVTRTDGSEKTCSQVRVTSRGLARLAKEMNLGDAPPPQPGGSKVPDPSAPRFL